MKVLKPTKQQHNKKLKFAGFDVETEPDNKNKFICACLYSDDFQKVFYSEDEVVEELTKKKYRNYKIVATNLPFDFFASFQDKTNHISITERNGRIYKANLYQQVFYEDKKTLIRRKPVGFYDTLNYIPCSVAKLGKIVGNPKMEHPYFFPKKPKNDVEMQMLVDYCMNDAIISQMFMQNIIAPWLEKNNLKFKMTIAGIAMEDFVNNYLKEELYQEPTEIHKKCFSAYYGGRTEVFKRGFSKNVNCYDVNSLYPSVMLNDFPNPNSFRDIKQTNAYIIDNYEGVSKVKVYVPKMKIPPLPYRKNKGDKLIFPCGIFEGTYCNVELRNAIKYGCKIIKYYDGVIYTKTYPYFKNFVIDHYNERLEHKKNKNPLEVMDKGVMNNLYGKFAMNYTESTTFQHKNDKIDMTDVVRIEPIGDYLSIKRVGYSDAPKYSFPIFSAYVTAYARIKMFEYMHKYEKDMIYTDTDSIFTNKTLPSSNKLGEFKLEDGYPVDSAIFVRPKVYISEIDNKFKIKLKGMSRITKEEWDNIIAGKTVYQERFTKHRTALRKKAKGENIRINEVITIPKHLSLNDDKRVWKGDFNPLIQQDSKPKVLTEDATKAELRRFGLA